MARCAASWQRCSSSGEQSVFSDAISSSAVFPSWQNGCVARRATIDGWRFGPPMFLSSFLTILRMPSWLRCTCRAPTHRRRVAVVGLAQCARDRGCLAGVAFWRAHKGTQLGTLAPRIADVILLVDDDGRALLQQLDALFEQLSLLGGVSVDARQVGLEKVQKLGLDAGVGGLPFAEQRVAQRRLALRRALVVWLSL
eukprot:1090354-Prymnesium_polylepis.1